MKKIVFGWHGGLRRALLELGAVAQQLASRLPEVGFSFGNRGQAFLHQGVAQVVNVEQKEVIDYVLVGKRAWGLELTADEGLLYARALEGLGDVRRVQQRFAEAEELYARAVPIWERLLGPEQPRLAVTLHNLGTVRWELGRCEPARQALLRAETIWARQPSAEPSRAAATTAALEAVRERCAAACDGR